MDITTFASSANGIGGGLIIVWLVVLVLAIAGMWATFQKAGKPGWAAIIPIYNMYIMLKIAGRPGWWLILFLIPFVNIIVSLVVSVDVAKAFGKSAAFGVLALWIFSIIGYLMLGFGDATYHGAGAAPGQPTGGDTPTTPAAPTAPTPPAAPQPPVV